MRRDLLRSLLANTRLDDFTLIDSAQTELTCALCDYMDTKRGRKNRDFYTLMFLLPSLRKLNARIQNSISQEIPSNVQFPAFFSRVFLNEQPDLVSERRTPNCRHARSSLKGYPRAYDVFMDATMDSSSAEY